MNIGTLLKKNEKNILDEKQQMSQTLIQQLRDLEIQIKANESLFNLTVDDALIEAVIYENRALQSRYGYYLRLAREYGLTYPPKVTKS